MTPPGTRVVVHSKSDERASWECHGEDGWYVGPAPNHYRCFKCCMPATHKEKVSDTVQLIPHTIPIINVTLVDHVAIVADNLVATLQHYSISPPTGIKIGDPTIHGVHKIAKILKTIYPLPQPPATPLPSPTPTQPPATPLSSPPRVQTPEENS